MLDGSIIQSELLGHELWTTTTRRCPQGGVLSPILWCLVVDSLITELNKSPYFIVGYADDLVIMTSGLFLSTTFELTLGAINDRIPKQFVFDKNNKIELYEDPWGGNNHRELSVFTDGSKTESGTGSGAFSEDLNIRNATAPGAHKTVFQAECVGITMAASAIEARKVRNYSIRILSDSKAVLMALKSDTIHSGQIYDCHHALSKLCVHNNITLQWIKGHTKAGSHCRSLTYKRT